MVVVIMMIGAYMLRTGWGVMMCSVLGLGDMVGAVGQGRVDENYNPHPKTRTSSVLHTKITKNRCVALPTVRL